MEGFRPVQFPGFGEIQVPQEYFQGDEATVQGNLDRVYRDLLSHRGQQQRQDPNGNSGLLDAVAGGLVGQGANIADGAGGLLSRVGATEWGAQLEETARRWRASAERTYQRPVDMPETTFQLLRQGRVADALSYLPRDVAESLSSVLTGIAATGAGPVGAAIYGTAMGLEQVGSMRQERREAGQDPTVGLIDVGAAAAGAAAQVLPGGRGIIRPLYNEARQEILQEGTAIGGNALQGVEYTPMEVVDRLGQAGVVAMGTRAGTDAAGAAARVPGRAAGAAVRGVADLTRRNAVRSLDDEQIASDLRVVEAYQRRRAAEQQETTNSNVDPSVTFKGVMEDYTRALRDLGDALEAGGQLTREQRRLFDAAVAEGAKHNREVAAQQGTPDYFDTLRTRLIQMGLDPRTEQTVISAIRDLNTATYNSKYKNKRGPFEAMASSFPAGGVVAGLGVAATGNPLAALTPLLVRGAVRRGGAALDRLAGTSQPEVLARQRVLAREAQNRGLQVNPLAPEIRTAAQGARVQAAQRAQAQSQAAAQYNAQANQMGLVRGGGWAPAIMQQASNIAPGTVDIEDPVRAVEDLARAGAIPRDRADRLINDRTARPTEPEMRLITDYVVSAATQVQREAWNRPQASQNAATAPSTMAPNPPVARVGNPAAYEAKMRQVADLEGQIQAAVANDPTAQAIAARVLGSKNRGDKQANLDGNRGLLSPEAQALLQAHVDMTSDRSRTPGSSTSVVGPEGQRARVAAARPGVSQAGLGRDPTARVSRRAGLVQGVQEDGRRAKDNPDNERRAQKTGKPGVVSASTFTANDLESGNQVTTEDFLRILNANEGGSTLTQYDPVEFQQDVASGKIRLFKAPGRDAVFAIKDGEDYSWTGSKHPALQRPHKVLVAVANNDPDLKGWGEAAARLAAEQGVTALDAFAVKNARAPEGILPRTYGKAGFHTVATMPFDPEFYGGEGSDQLATLEKYWDLQQWDRSTGRPSLAVMVHESALPRVPEGADPALYYDRITREQRAEAAQAKAKEILDRGVDIQENLVRGVSLVPDLQALDNGKVARDKRSGAIDTTKELLEPRRAEAGVGAFDRTTPEGRKAMADVLYYETLNHLANSRNALDWYDGKVRNMFRMASKVYPELETNPTAKAVFTTVLAVTSNGVNVIDNFRLTFDHYEKIRDAVANGDIKIPPTIKGVDKAGNMNATFKTWNALVDKFNNPQELVNFMETEFRAGDLANRIYEILGPTGKTKDGKETRWQASEEVDTMIPGASILGPKIGGGFWANLRGIYKYVTQDRWFVRTMARLEGRLYENKGDDEKTRARLAAAITPEVVKEFGLPKVRDWSKASPDVLRAAALKIHSKDTSQGYPRSSQVVKNGRAGNGKLVDGKEITPASHEARQVAKIVSTGIKGAMIAQPANKKTRTQYRDVINDVLSRLSKDGIEITAADLQAVIWFPEQRFWQQALKSGSKKTDADYEDAVVMYMLGSGRDQMVRDVYKTMGYTDREIDGLIADRKKKRDLILKEKSEDTDGDEEADE